MIKKNLTNYVSQLFMIVDIIFVAVVIGLLIAIYKLKFQSPNTYQQIPLNEGENQEREDAKVPSWATTQQQESDEDIKDGEPILDKKKLMRKQMKAKEKKQRKEAMQHFLEEQKKKRQKYDEQQEEKQKIQEEKIRKEEEHYRMLVEEEEKKKKAQYDKWKNMFSVEEEGKSKDSPEEEERKKQQFRKGLSLYLIKSKLSKLQDLAHRFKLTTKQTIEKIKQLQELGMINGIFDERGKYLVIEEKQWEAIKNYIKARGRVKKTDIMQECARIIKIPEETDLDEQFLSLLNEQDQK